MLAADAAPALDLPTWAAWGLGGVLFILLASGTLIVPSYFYRSERRDRLAAEEREREAYRQTTERMFAAIDKLGVATDAFQSGMDRMLSLVERRAS